MSHHILIVDDEAEIRQLLEQFLSISGYRIATVATAREALAHAAATPPDLVISDLQLEESDGLDLIAKLKAAQPGLPVILLTSVLFDRQTVEENLSKRVSAYLPKTTPLNQLLAEIQRLLAAGK
ncbi:MAG TPA: response regulator [Opitutaceae bacterium]|nr:response regulator [Opitutaceae bacterium]HRJ48194.1 response regulator [Opitutaceae bacterium]